MDSQWDCQQISQEDGKDIQTESNGQTFHDQFGNCSAFIDGNGSTEIAPDCIFHPESETDDCRLIQVQFFLDDLIAPDFAFLTGKHTGGTGSILTGIAGRKHIAFCGE